jgi:hypothetical protein
MDISLGSLKSGFVLKLHHYQQDLVIYFLGAKSLILE